MKPVAWRIFRGGRWSYADSRSNRLEDRVAWQALYTEADLKAEFERGRQQERALWELTRINEEIEQQ